MLIEPRDDGLVLPDVGRWSKRKYHSLGRYLHLFSTGMKNKWPQRHYIDLFAGAGFARIRGTSEIVAGSPVMAANARDPFTALHCCERDARKVEALRHRLGAAKSTTSVLITEGDANASIGKMLRSVPTRGALCITFADPFGLHLDFETVQAVASRQSDLIILLADNMDALRNWAAYYDENPNSNLDRFMGEPGWREELKQARSDQFAQRLRDRYRDRLRTLGYAHFDSERVENDRGADIYSLVFASRNSKGLEFWDKARSVDEGGQRALFT